VNANLLTIGEKAENRRGRDRRNARRQALCRRQRLLRELVFATGSGSGSVADQISAEESLELLSAHLRRARSIAVEIRRTWATAAGVRAPLALAPISEPLPRPERILRARNRSQRCPGLLIAAVPLDRESSIVQAISEIKEKIQAGMSPVIALDFFVGSCDIPWQESNGLLAKCGLIPTPLSPIEVDATRCARAFWNGYAEGRSMFTTMIAAGEITIERGDWAVFNSRKLRELLPGMSIPRLLRRQTYLTNLVREGSDLCLDLYSYPGKLPLVRHPFGL
jgi:hypothetical protein